MFKKNILLFIFSFIQNVSTLKAAFLFDSDPPIFCETNLKDDSCFLTEEKETEKEKTDVQASFIEQDGFVEEFLVREMDSREDCFDEIKSPEKDSFQAAYYLTRRSFFEDLGQVYILEEMEFDDKAPFIAHQDLSEEKRDGLLKSKSGQIDF